jgi:hypothetical protein
MLGSLGDHERAKIVEQTKRDYDAMCRAEFDPPTRGRT